MKNLILFHFCLCGLVQFAGAQSGSITNVIASQRTDGSGIVDIYYDFEALPGSYYINLQVSFNAGSSYSTISSQYISGDINNVSPGGNKNIIWYGMGSDPDRYSASTKLMLIAYTFPQSVTDYDGNVYNTILIGSQVWMAENLKTTHYRNGVSIEYPGSNITQWQNNTTGAYAWYGNDISRKDEYGALYNWYAVNNVNWLCPTGWHVPSDAEWTTLTTYVGGDIAGGKLKSTRTSPDPHPRWNSPNTGATNQYGFSALPGGYRVNGGTYTSMGYIGLWWSSTAYSSTSAWYRTMDYNYATVFRSGNGKASGVSVRCVRD